MCSCATTAHPPLPQKSALFQNLAKMQKRSQKSKKQNRKRLASRSLVKLSRGSSLRSRLDPYLASTPHYFCRDLDDGILYTNGVGSVTCRDSTGALPPWFNLSALNTDQGGVSATYQFGMSIAPKLADLADYTQFSALFERYELLKCEVRMSVVMGDSYNGVASQLPYLYSCIDNTDNQPPTNQLTIQRFDNCQEQTLSNDRDFVRSFHPVPSVQVFVAALAVGYGTPAAPRWMDSQYPTIPHYGIKFYIRNWIGSATNLGNAVRIQPKLWFRMKATH